MPNNVDNTVSITGPLKDRKALQKFLKGDDSDFDFNKIVPMPDALRETVTGGCTIDGIDCRVWREKDGKKFAMTAMESVGLRRKYGADNWYDWAIKAWGTKWNAYNVSVKAGKDELVYEFQTAWSSPEGLIQRLAEKFKTLQFDVEVGGEVDRPWRYGHGPYSEGE